MLIKQISCAWAFDCKDIHVVKQHQAGSDTLHHNVLHIISNYNVHIIIFLKWVESQCALREIPSGIYP